MVWAFYICSMMRQLGLFILYVIVILISSCSKKEADRDRFFLLGNKALSEKEYGKAIHNYSEAIKIDEKYADAFNNRGIAYFEGGDHIFALQDYNQALRINPEFIDAIYNRSRVFISLKRYNDAIADLHKVSSVYQDSVYVKFALGMAHHQNGSQDSAKHYFNQAAKLAPENAEIYVNLGVVHFHTNQLDSAILYANKAIDLNPDELYAYNLLGQVYDARKDWLKSIYYYNQGLNLDRYHPILLNNRGFAYINMDSMQLAKEDIDQSILRDTDNLWSYRNKGYWYLKMSDPASAERLLLRALDEKDYVKNVYSYLGLTYLQLNQQSKACEMFRKGQQRKEPISLNRGAMCN